MYSVTHSTDPWLLSRLMTDLQMEGFEMRETILGWNDEHNPFTSENVRWLMVYHYNSMNFHAHEGCPNPTRFTLTESNYLEVLKAIVNGKNK